MTEKFVVVLRDTDSDILGLMDMKSGLIEYLPPLPANMRVEYLDGSEHKRRYGAAGHNSTLCFAARVYSDPDNYVVSLIKYDDTTKEYTIGMSDFANTLCSLFGIASSDAYAEYDYEMTSNSYVDHRGKWLWFSVVPDAGQPKYIFTVNIETFEAEIASVQPYLAGGYGPHENVGYLTKASIVVTRGGYGRSKVFKRDDESFPILDLDRGAVHTVISIDEDNKKVFWHGVDLDEWEAYLIQTDLVSGEEAIFMHWYGSGGADGLRGRLPPIFLANGNASEMVWIEQEEGMWGGAGDVSKVVWIDEGGISKVYEPPINVRLSGPSYLSNNTDDVFLYGEDDMGATGLIVRRDGTVTDLRSLHPSAYSDTKTIKAMCTWGNTPLSPKRFWTQFNQTEEIIEG